MTDPITHGPELDAAVEAALDPESLGSVCEAALTSRTTDVVEHYIHLANETARDPELALAPVERAQAGLTGAIGGAFQLGLATGLALAEHRATSAIAPRAHSWANGFCVACGYAQAAVDGTHACSGTTGELGRLLIDERRAA